MATQRIRLFGVFLAVFSELTYSWGLHAYGASEPERIWAKIALHEGSAIALSPNGEQIAVGSAGCGESNIRTIRIADGQVIRTFSQCAHYVNTMAFSPDGRFLAVGANAHIPEDACEDCSCEKLSALAVWDLIEPRAVPKVLLGVGNIAAVAFSPDGNWLVAGGDTEKNEEGRKERVAQAEFELPELPQYEEVIQVWNARDWRLVHTLQPGGKPITSLIFSPDAKALAVGGEEGVRLWRFDKTGPEINGPTVLSPEGFTSLAFSADGNFLFSGNSRGQLRIWRISDGVAIKDVSTPGASVVHFSGDGKYLLAANIHDAHFPSTPTPEVTVSILDGENGSLLQALTWAETGSPLRAIGVSFKHCLVATLSPNLLSIWELTERGLVLRKRLWWLLVDEGETSPVIAFSPEGDLVAADHFVIARLRVSAEQDIAFISTSLWPEQIIFPDEKTAYLVTPPGYGQAGRVKVEVWKWPEGRWLRGFELPRSKLAFSADGELVASCCENHQIVLRSGDTGAVLRRFPAHAGDVVSMAFCGSKKFLASGDENGVGIWRVADGQLVHSLKAEGNQVCSVAFSPDSKLLAFSDCQVNEWRIVEKVVVKLLDVENQRLVGAIVPEERCGKLAFSADGQLLACWGFEAPSVTLYRIPGGTLAFTIPEQAESVAFSRDGRFLAVGGPGSLSLWRLPKLK
jgi:WD40 repeat protein